MKIIGLTGGIGSGKTTVAKMFQELGVPIYIADIESKKLSNTSELIREELIALLGEEAYVSDELNRKFVADKIFTDKLLLEKVNAIIHPRVAEHFQQWVNEQKAPYVIKEVAILFENGGEVDCDSVILVTAPKKIRIERVMTRDNTTIQDVENRMKNQWSDEKKRERSHFVIENIDLDHTKDQVITIDNLLRTKN